MTRIALLPFVALAFGLAGCQAKLSVSKTVKVPDGPDVAHVVRMSAQPGAQTITVSVKVTAGPPVDVFVIKSSDVSDAIAGDQKEKKSWDGNAFTSKRGVTNASVTAKVPAKTDFTVVVVPSDDAKAPSTVELKITN